MRTQNKGSEEIRRRAEKILVNRDASRKNLPPEGGTRALIQELQVHQVELEMQNEELRRAQEEIEKSQQHYYEFYEFSPVGYCTLDSKGLIMQTNLRCADLLEVERSALMRRSFSRFVAPDQQLSFRTFIEDTVRSQKPRRWEGQLARAGKVPCCVHIEATSVYDGQGDFTYLRTVILDITDRKRAEEATQQKAQENATIAQIGRVISSSLNIEGIYEKFAASARQIIPFDRIAISIINQESRTVAVTYVAGRDIPGREEGIIYPLTGSIMEDVLRSRRSLLLQGKSSEEVQRNYPRHLGFQTGFRSFLAAPLISGNQVIGGLYLCSTQSAPYEERHVLLAEGVANQIAGAVANARLFRECRQAEEWERLARRTLELLNRVEGTQDTVRDILQLIKQSTNFEAVGIRLREGDDFPYYAADGFAEEFVKDEKTLCARDEAGEIARDGQGNPLLECMCGNILSGRFDPTLPFFSAGGSFWTNSTTELLASTTEKERQARTRNRCAGEGYESVGLIPLRSGREIIGLLQLNDRKRNRFTPEMVRALEGLGNSIGIALARERSHEQIKASLKEKSVLLAEIHHRVKNNMQVISSLLRLQSRRIKDEELNKVFLDSQTRIRSMALIHEKLYRSEDFSRIEMAGYIRNLAAGLYSSYGVKRERIELKVQGEGIFLGIKEAVPCSLIVNELISNILKHAFPGEREGAITIALEAGDGKVKISVKDNGVGMAADLDLRKTESLGMQLVMTLVEQLEGAIDLRREGGTEFVITFASAKKE